MIVSSVRLFAQDDLLALVNEDNDKSEKVYATFKTYRLGNGQSIETVKKKHMDYRVAHRFGNLYNSTLANPLNESAHTAFGFDAATDLRNSLDFGLLDNLTIGIGRSRFNELVDGSVKWRFLTQTSDFKTPVSMAVFASAGYTTMKSAVLYGGILKDFKTNEAHRLNYIAQIIIACKITSGISLQLVPSYSHRNFIKQNINSNNDSEDTNDIFSLGFGGRIKLTKRMSIIGDYFFNFSPFFQNNPTAFNPLSIGFEFETGGHVFSLSFTNASALTENNFIPYTVDSWQKGQVKFGFCLSRTFSL